MGPRSISAAADADQRPLIPVDVEHARQLAEVVAQLSAPPRTLTPMTSPHCCPAPIPRRTPRRARLDGWCGHSVGSTGFEVVHYEAHALAGWTDRVDYRRSTHAAHRVISRHRKLPDPPLWVRELSF